MTILRALLLISAVGVWGMASVADAETTGACQDEPNLLKRLACFIDAAKAADDPTVCLAADEGTVIFNCISKYAEDTGRVDACAQIPVDIDPNVDMVRESCVAGVAVKQRDPGICAGIEATRMRDSCYFIMVTQGGADRQICERIQAPHLRRGCRGE